jgi:hypothetical protein
MVSYRDCIGEIKRYARGPGGRNLTDDEALNIVEKMYQRLRLKRAANAFRTAEEAAALVVDEMTAEVAQATMRARRDAMLNLVTRFDRRNFIVTAPAQGRRPGFVNGMFAKLVGSDTPFANARRSVAAEGEALEKDYLGALIYELQSAGTFEAVRSGKIDRLLAREIWERGRDGGGQPGVTNMPELAKAAEVIHRVRAVSRDRLNRAGAWIGSLDGYIARTAHDPDLVRRAGVEGWRDFILPRLDLEKTFGGADPDQFLRGAWHALITGHHFTPDGMQGFKDPSPTGPANLAERLSQGRVLHFKDADGWTDYHERFAGKTLLDSIKQDLSTAAKHTALMRAYGTNPRAEFDADLRWLVERYRDSDPDAVILFDQKYRRALVNRFAVLEGTALRTDNRQAEHRATEARALQSVALLGASPISSLSDIATAAIEQRHQGMNFLEGLFEQVRGLLPGGKPDRETLQLLRAGVDTLRADMLSLSTAGDSAPGVFSKLANLQFKISGQNWWTDRLRAVNEAVLSRELGLAQGKGFDELDPRRRRALEAFGIDAARWDALRSLDWYTANGRRYLTPDAALRLSDDQVRAIDADADPVRFRDDLAIALHAYYADSGQLAVLQPGAAEKAIMFQGAQPGTPTGELLRFFWQFKSFPLTVVTKRWARDYYGNDAGLGAIAPLVMLFTAMTGIGSLSMVIKDLLKGKNPRDPADVKTWLAAMAQGGGAGIYGDFIFGEHSRFGMPASATLLGPIVGQVDSVFELYHRWKKGDDAAAQIERLVVRNTPFANLFYTRAAFDYLIHYQLQETLNPGFLRRMERRIEKENSQTFWLRPSVVVR